MNIVRKVHNEFPCHMFLSVYVSSNMANFYHMILFGVSKSSMSLLLFCFVTSAVDGLTKSC